MPNVIVLVIGKRDDVRSRPQTVDVLKRIYRIGNYRPGLISKQGKQGGKALMGERALWKAELGQNVRTATPFGRIIRASKGDRPIQHFFGPAPVEGSNCIPSRIVIGLKSCFQEV
jgi:hypothetical protein